MRIRVQTVTGEFYISDPLTEQDLKEINLTEEQAKDEMSRLFQEFSELTYLSIEMGGTRRFFNPVNVVWAELID